VKFYPGNSTLLVWLLLTALCLPLWAAAQDTAGQVDTYLDPLAFARVNESAEDVAVTVKYQATGETRRIDGRYLLTDSAEMYVPSSAAAGIFKAARFWQGNLRRLELKIASSTFAMTGGSRLVTTEDGEVLLPVPVLDFDGDLWLPMVMLEKVVGPGTMDRVSWDAEARRLELGSARYNVTGFDVKVLGSSTAIHVRCSEPLGFRATSPRPGTIDLKIYNAEVNTSRVGRQGRRGLLLSARSRQHSDHGIVSLQVDDLVGRFRTYTEDDGREIVIILEEEQVSALPNPVPHGRANVNIDQGPVDVTHEIHVRTVVIDPGHGGHDVGAVGRRGILEKNVNLGVAKELRRYLERESDLKVVLTRDDDDFVELADRAELANRSDGDLFISLHCNSWFNDGAHGFETFFLSPAKSDWAKSVEAAENQSSDDRDDVDFIVWELVQNSFISSSSQLAEVIQAEVCNDLDLMNRGVRQAGFRVLVGAYMPAVLVELGFLTHANEESNLGDRTYQRQLAKALGDAILTYGEQTAAALPVSTDGEEASSE